MWKWLIGIFLVCVVICGVGGYFAATNKELKKQFEMFMPGQKAVEVRLEKAVNGELSKTVSAPGQIEPKTEVKISAQVSALIVALPFEVNSPVKKGDVVVRLDSRDLVAQLESARANLRGEEARLEGAQATLERARMDRDRAKKLSLSGDRTPAELEAAETRYLEAQASLSGVRAAIESARAQITRAEKDVENAIIKSPIDGVITALEAKVGELVVIGTLNNAASVIMQIADLSQMVLTARVDESNIVPVKEGQTAKVFINAYGEREFKARVGRVELQRRVDRDNTGYFEVELPIELSSGETLRSGLTANTDIAVETLRDVLVVPSQAVLDRKVDELPKAITDGNPNVSRTNTFTRVVYRVEDAGKKTPDGKSLKKVIATPVTVGSSDLTRTVIVSGLKAGDEIVSGPFKVLITLKHDQEVMEESAGKASESKVAEAKSTETKPTESKPTESKPAESKSPESKDAAAKKDQPPPATAGGPK